MSLFKANGCIERWIRTISNILPRARLSDKMHRLIIACAALVCVVGSPTATVWCPGLQRGLGRRRTGHAHQSVSLSLSLSLSFSFSFSFALSLHGPRVSGALPAYSRSLVLRNSSKEPDSENKKNIKKIDLIA